MSIVVVGSVAIDNIKTPHGEVAGVLGGSATYFSIAASYFGPVKVLSIVGKDFPEKHFGAFHSRGVDTDGILKDEGSTFCWTGSYNDTMSEATTLNVSVNVLENYKPQIPDGYKSPDVLFLANIDPGVQAEVLKGVQARHLRAMDTMNIWIDIKREEVMRALAAVDLVVLNDAEARQLTGEFALPGAAKKIAGYGPKRVIIKKGEHGAVMYSGGRFFMMPAYIQERLIDTTGAGDTFAGGFLGALYETITKKNAALSEADFRRALVFGNVMASFAVEDFSVNRLLKLQKGDIEKRYQEILKLVRVE